MNHIVPESNEAQPPIPACSVIANCPLHTDIVLVSCDGHRFGTHCKNLGDFTGAFPLDIAPANGEEVPIPDIDSEALSLFLQYVHHHRQPDLSNVPFGTLIQLAEAVEKYDLFSATEICKVQMIRFVPDHCVEVFQYTAKHGYAKLMDEAGLRAIQSKYLSCQILVGLSHRPDIQAAWSRYTIYWVDSVSGFYNEPLPILHPGGVEDCRLWWKFSNVVFFHVKHGGVTFSSFGDIVEYARHYLEECRYCGIRADNWSARVAQHGRNSQHLRQFTSFL